MPHDEALHGHPLSPRGLSHYDAYEVMESSWIRALERVNSVHERHDASRYRGLRHFILTFHDSTFECVARTFSVSIGPGMPHAAALRALVGLGGAAG
jgi:hypothetical protein